MATTITDLGDGQFQFVGEDGAIVVIKTTQLDPFLATERKQVLQNCADRIAECLDPPVVRGILAGLEMDYPGYSYLYSAEENTISVKRLSEQWFDILYPEKEEFHQRIELQERQLTAHADHINRLEMVMQLIRDDPDMTLEMARAAATGVIGGPHGGRNQRRTGRPGSDGAGDQGDDSGAGGGAEGVDRPGDAGAAGALPTGD